MNSSLDRQLGLSPEPIPSPWSTAGQAVAPETQSIAAALASAFDRMDLSPRVRVLRHLLLPIGPLALAALGGGIFAKYAREGRWSGMPLSPEEAARVTPTQVYEIVRYLEQSDPHSLREVLCSLVIDATTRDALGASVDGIVIQYPASSNAGRAVALPRKYLLVRVIESCDRSRQPRKIAAMRTHRVKRGVATPDAARAGRVAI